MKPASSLKMLGSAMSFAPTNLSALMGTDRSAGDVTEDAVLGGRLRLRQPRRGHRVGHDAILLAAAVPARAGETVIDWVRGSARLGSRLRPAYQGSG